MTSIAKQVWKEIEEDVIVRRGLEKGIISMKNLAMYLIKKKKLYATADAVISAIRRYKEDQPLESKFEMARKVIASSQSIRITSNILEIALEKNKQTQELLQKVFSLIDYDKGEIALFIQGEQAIKLIINDKNKEKILPLFPKRNILNLEKELAEINIQLSDEAVRTPGIISVLSTELMIHDVNIVESMSCVPEMLFFVKQKDVVKSYEILFSLSQKKIEK
ncbi:hypothetical protein J4421_01770 [Candidatus Woesearchaeota archaeon]|nr:hypothetical protein [Candidatus Woesearchaeota archaeon]